MSTISAGKSVGTALVVSGDTTGDLTFQVSGTVTALTLSAGATATLSNITIFPSGTASAPAVTTTGDTNTGLYFPAADQVAVTTGGTVAAAFNSNGLFFRNRIINGDMRIDQRNAGAAVTTSGTFPVDRWINSFSTSAGAVSLQQSTAVVPTGFTHSIGVTVTTADASIAASEFFQINQWVEGNNIADFNFGTANARTITLSFWVRSSVTGIYCVVIGNSNAGTGAANRSYVAEYTISVANTWEYKTVTIAGDTSGTWQTGSLRGMLVRFGLTTGTDFQQAAGSWGTVNAVGSANQTQLLSTLNATWYVTGVQLETGSVATPFERRPYGTELMLCQRYFEKGSFVSATAINTGGIYPSFPFKVTKRVAAASCTSTNSRSLTLAIINDDSTSGLASSIYQNSNDSAASITYFTVSAEL